ncbi:MAG: Nramp family divalent metal transporter [Planctomycetia bacterium]
MSHENHPGRSPGDNAGQQFNSGIPPWTIGELPQAKPLGLKNLAGLIGPGIVMCGIQIGGGEWLMGPVVTAKYGGNLMWIATIAIITQAFYNIECGRYALYCGEPVFTGFMRTFPGPRFWMAVTAFLCLAFLIPGLSTNAAVLLATVWLDRPPGPEDSMLVNGIAYACLGGVVLPVLIGGKVFNMLQLIMTAKVFIVLGFCLFLGVCFVGAEGWGRVFGGFLKFGNVPVQLPDGKEGIGNIFESLLSTGALPAISLTHIATLGAFAGYAGGGGLSNSSYGNFVRDKGWGMGSQVGAIASAVGGHHITLSHTGKVFPITPESLKRWNGWWKYILSDQCIVWVPGCFMGMALPALMSIEFAKNSPMYGKELPYSQPLIAADGVLHTASLGSWAPILWGVSIFTGLVVFLPSQMAIVDDVARRWTDILWSGSRRVRNQLKDNQAKGVYYTILFAYVIWTFITASIFLRWPDAPKVMVTVIANFNNLALAITSFHILRINCTLLPEPLRPRWYSQVGIACCGLFYSGLTILIGWSTILPILKAAF